MHFQSSKCSKPRIVCISYIVDFEIKEANLLPVEIITFFSRNERSDSGQTHGKKVDGRMSGWTGART